MATMGGKAFVDTNILLRAIIPQMDQHGVSESLIQQMWENDVELWISRQVIREYLVQATHPKSFQPVLTIDQVLSQMDVVTSLFQVADETSEVTTTLFELIRKYGVRGKQTHDTSLVATMVVYQIDTLLTLNVKDFVRFQDKIKLVSP